MIDRDEACLFSCLKVPCLFVCPCLPFLLFFSEGFTLLAKRQSAVLLYEVMEIKARNVFVKCCHAKKGQMECPLPVPACGRHSALKVLSFFFSIFPSQGQPWKKRFLKLHLSLPWKSAGITAMSESLHAYYGKAMGEKGSRPFSVCSHLS